MTVDAGKAEISRRQVLKAALGATALFFPAPYAWVWAQSEGTLKLLRQPKMALVLGNSKYSSVPALVNPANDAHAISEALTRSGFEVTTRLDGTLDGMHAAIQAYVKTLADRKAVGLFYFAGHGLQSAWRNYLVPVDAALQGPADIARSCVDLTGLIEGLTKAANPMNVVILDACRDYPFGTQERSEARGLSQMDAPINTILAYATAPGNVASDGEGANGLYTENLLREMRVQDAKIEDVFKRVRLKVRLKTNGQQIPWESTSLEVDFYFVPPNALMSQAEAEAQRERQQQAALMEKRRAEEEAARKAKEEQARREAQQLAEAAERKRQQELAQLQAQRSADEARRKREQEQALAEARRVAEAAERARREEQARREAELAEEAAARKYREELALVEKRRQEAEAESKRRETQALAEARAAAEEAARQRDREKAQLEKRLAEADAERRKQQTAPVVIAEPTKEELQRRYDEELAGWEAVKASTTTLPLQDYLLRYPSGRFSELAQVQLDRILARQGEKKIRIASNKANPYSKGTGILNLDYKVGDSYQFRNVDILSGIEGNPYRETVVGMTDQEIIYNKGLTRDYLGNLHVDGRGRPRATTQTHIAEYAIGKRWSTRAENTTLDGTHYVVELNCRVVALETITVPAGTFEAFRIESNGFGTFPRYTISYESRFWMAPERLRRQVAGESLWRRGSRLVNTTRQELVAFREK